MDIFLTKKLGTLRPADRLAEDQLAEIPDGATVRAKVTRPRSVQHHRLFFALLKFVHEHTAASERWPEFDDFRDIVTIGSGYYRWVEKPNGGRFPKATSIAFHKMDQAAFNTFFEEAITCISDKLGLVDAPDLRREFQEMLWTAA